MKSKAWNSSRQVYNVSVASSSHRWTWDWCTRAALGDPWRFRAINADEVREVEFSLGPSQLESGSVVGRSCFLGRLVSAEPYPGSMFVGVSDLCGVFPPRPSPHSFEVASSSSGRFQIWWAAAGERRETLWVILQQMSANRIQYRGAVIRCEILLHFSSLVSL